MITQIATIHLFYPMLFTVLIVLIIAVCSVIKSRNGNMTFKDMFCKSSDNAKEITLDTTSKMADMHNNIVKLDFTSVHEKELDQLEKGYKKLKENVEYLNEKVDELFERIIKLEINHK